MGFDPPRGWVPRPDLEQALRERDDALEALARAERATGETPGGRAIPLDDKTHYERSLEDQLVRAEGQFAITHSLLLDALDLLERWEIYADFAADVAADLDLPIGELVNDTRVLLAEHGRGG